MTACALFRLPYSDTYTIVEQGSGHPEELVTAWRLDGREGFVVAPFAITAAEPTAAVAPDRIDQSTTSETEVAGRARRELRGRRCRPQGATPATSPDATATLGGQALLPCLHAAPPSGWPGEWTPNSFSRRAPPVSAHVRSSCRGTTLRDMAFATPEKTAQRHIRADGTPWSGRAHSA